jgi:hypothetical protein
LHIRVLGTRDAVHLHADHGLKPLNDIGDISTQASDTPSAPSRLRIGRSSPTHARDQIPSSPGRPTLWCWRVPRRGLLLEENDVRAEIHRGDRCCCTRCAEPNYKEIR